MCHHERAIEWEELADELDEPAPERDPDRAEATGDPEEEPAPTLADD